MARRVVVALVAVILLTSSLNLNAVTAVTSQQTLASHYVQGWGFRDQLNASDADYENFWTDNAGKILTTSAITGDSTNAGRALGFILEHMTNEYYLPEVVVNSSILHLGSGEEASLTNRIITIGVDSSASELDQLSLGDYYAGGWTAGYLGADRIWYGGSAHSALAASITLVPGGYSKTSYFSFDGFSFYTYLNATLVVGRPYIRVSVQVRPLDSTFGAGDHIDLQVFSSGIDQQHAFENAALFDSKGDLAGIVPADGASAPTGNGVIVSYSNETSVFDQDAVAIAYNATGTASLEHWYRDPGFSRLSWTGVGFNVPATAPGELSAPMYADVYPIQHLDFRVLADTVRYLESRPRDVAVSPPVSFGFVARGLALAANEDPGNLTIQRAASGYWNFYYERYNGTVAGTAYARSVSLFALAGFEMFGANKTVESFTRNFVEAYSGSSIEEYGWAAAALHALYLYSGSASDVESLQGVENSFVPGGDHFLGLAGTGARVNSTFEFGEAAAGLLTAEVPFNSSSVLWAMNAVFASNTTGILYNFIQHNDLANTETIPAITLSNWLFDGAMRSRTGYWIEWTHMVNITSIRYHGSALEIKVVGKNGTVGLGTPEGIMVCSGINGAATLPCSPQASWAWVLYGLSLSGIAILFIAGVWYVRRRLESRGTTR